MESIAALPEEVLDLTFSFLIPKTEIGQDGHLPTLATVSRVSRQFHRIVFPHLFHTIKVHLSFNGDDGDSWSESQENLLKVLRRCPSGKKYVKNFILSNDNSSQHSSSISISQRGMYAFRMQMLTVLPELPTPMYSIFYLAELMRELPDIEYIDASGVKYQNWGDALRCITNYMDDTSKLKRIDLGSHSDVVAVCQNLTKMPNLDTLVMYVNDGSIMYEYQSNIYPTEAHNNIKAIALCGIKRNAWCSCYNPFKISLLKPMGHSSPYLQCLDISLMDDKNYPELFYPLIYAAMIRFPQLQRLEYWSIAALGDMNYAYWGPRASWAASEAGTRRPPVQSFKVNAQMLFPHRSIRQFVEGVVPASVVHLTLRLKNRDVDPRNRLYISFLRRLVLFFDDMVEAIGERGAFADLRAVDLETPAGSVPQVLRDIGTKIQKVEPKIEFRILDSAITPRWIVSGRYHSDFTPVAE